MADPCDCTRIIAAAIRPFGSADAVTLPAPARHHDIIRHMGRSGFSLEEIAMAEQGFVSVCGVFYNRKTAHRMARECGQLPRPSCHPSELFSEDLW